MNTDEMSDYEPSPQEMVIQELSTRIGKITSQYEVELAVLKAQATQQITALQQRLSETETKADKHA